MPTGLLLQGKGAAQLTGDGSAWVQEIPVYARQVESRTVGNVMTIYRGWADYGTATDEAGWRITRLVMDETSGLDITELAAGTGDFDQVWDNRASLTYA